MNNEYIKFSNCNYYIPPIASQQDVIELNQIKNGEKIDTRLSEESLKNIMLSVKVFENTGKILGYKNVKKVAGDLKLAKKWFSSQTNLIESLDVSLHPKEEEKEETGHDKKAFWKAASSSLFKFVTTGKIIHRFEIVHKIASAIHLSSIVEKSIEQSFETSLQGFSAAKLEAKCHIKGLNFAKSIKVYNQLNSESSEFEKKIAILDLIKNAFQFSSVASRVVGGNALLTSALVIAGACIDFMQSAYGSEKEDLVVTPGSKYLKIHSELDSLMEKQFTYFEDEVKKICEPIRVGLLDDLNLDQASYKKYLESATNTKQLQDIVISYRNKCLDSLEFNGIDVTQAKRELEVFLEFLNTYICKWHTEMQLCQGSLETELTYLRDKLEELEGILARLDNKTITFKAPRRITLDVIHDLREGISKLKAKEKHIVSLLMKVSPVSSEDKQYLIPMQGESMENKDLWIQEAKQAISNEELDAINDILHNIKIDFDTYPIISC